MPSFCRTSRGADAFPGRGELDQDALAADAARLIGRDDGAGLVDRGFRVEGEVGVDLGGDAAGHELGEGRADGNRQPVGDGGNDALAAAALRLAPAQRLGDGVGKHRRAQRLQDDGRIGRAVDGLQAGDGFDVAGVRDDGRHRTQLF